MRSHDPAADDGLAWCRLTLLRAGDTFENVEGKVSARQWNDASDCGGGPTIGTGWSVAIHG